ncbi:hypothetical protein I6N95_17350 [Vagococcus sp. BWB3-3]|uniref:Alternate-type signal peptide domain-containing protein n=1 Tax=Vagococcus allomyrinae TaxID=2794353 RepID=A0A940P7F8_9ENTE|nr:hypothetical protein [Vagococcus allomyrinae]MBP1042787.1 hypothetical protein [Vagococcus allomyrinae]
MKSTKKNKKKKLAAAAAALAIIAAVSGTFAWISSQDQRINRVKTAAIKDGSVTVSEIWRPTDIIPGTETDKQVTVTNAGATSVFVRVSYEEVLKHLADKGVVSTSTTGWVAAATPSIEDSIPVEFDGKKYVDNVDYADITSAVKVSGAVLPANVKVYGKGAETINPLNGEKHIDFDYAMFFEYETGKYQAMRHTVKPVNTGANFSDWTFEATDLEYEIYANGYKYEVANWANSTLVGNTTEAMTAKAALLGTAGTKYGVDYDYKAASMNLGAEKLNRTLAVVGQYPTTSGATSSVQTDKNALNISGIHITYGTDIVTPTSLVNKKWAYNIEDGYFYYTSPLGASETTPNLLEKLVFDNKIDQQYTNATYDLVVKLEAIQGNKAALVDDSGWGLSDDELSTPNTKKILEHLSGQAPN